VKTHLARLDRLAKDAMWAVIAELENQGREQLVAEGVAPQRIEMRYSADLRYVGQGSELAVPVARAAAPAAIERAFHAAHENNNGHSRPAHPVELVNLRVAAFGRLERPSIGASAIPAAAPERTSRSVRFGGQAFDCAVFDRAQLPAGWTAAGPAIIEEFGSTTVLLPGWDARVDALGNLRLTAGASER
jgi:N-methylhydantoinase A